MHWTMKWLGTPFVEGRYDCLDFVQEVMLADFGRTIRLPARERVMAVRAMARSIRDLGTEAAVPTAGPVEGDGVLLKPVGTRITGFHVGLHAMIDGTPFVLHCAETLGGVLHPAAGIRCHGWEIEGYYRWL